MPLPYSKLHVHLVWSTWKRLPLITPEVEAVLYPCLLQESLSKGACAVAVGGVADHVHLLVRMPTTLTVTELVKQIKGRSSRHVNESTGALLRWQAGYGAFSISCWDLPRLKRYIERQREHHAGQTLSPKLEYTGN